MISSAVICASFSPLADMKEKINTLLKNVLARQMDGFQNPLGAFHVFILKSP